MSIQNVFGNCKNGMMQLQQGGQWYQPSHLLLSNKHQTTNLFSHQNGYGIDTNKDIAINLLKNVYRKKITKNDEEMLKWLSNHQSGGLCQNTANKNPEKSLQVQVIDLVGQLSNFRDQETLDIFFVKSNILKIKLITCYCDLN